MPAPSRWVLHLDLDQFVAAVEVLRRPELVGRQVVVGGRGDPTERAVVSTASYEARALGVGSGMPLRTAARLAPEAVFLPVDRDAYDRASQEVMHVVRRHGRLEVLGWDEAFLAFDGDDPETFARSVQRDVLDQTRLHCSIGIGDNKIRAKMATGFGKPQGVFRLTAANWAEVMGARPTRDLWGVGPAVAKRLAGHGIRTVTELAEAETTVLVAELGPRMGTWYGELGRGDGSAVVDDTPRLARGHSRETTFQRDLTDAAEVDDALASLAAQVMQDIATEGRPVIRLTLKVRYVPFFTKTFSRTLTTPTEDLDVVVRETLVLAGKREPGRAIRLLGLRAEMATPGPDPVDRTPIRGLI